ncbi:hypothetical protein [Crossiella cryophila]|uniref:Uncharacterized protein n=1 Tax=Crossiella cryophila TaxID=43355 RepID=A0A7W7CI98_9PSEU|nr:hypothetical protein [Crossiella cryophila]MBB4681718.1 hypothetical protein [Crossiella cryophila]
MTAPDPESAGVLLGQARTVLLERWGDLVEAVFSYGAVEVDPAHLTVWVLLKGQADGLPEWYQPHRQSRPAGLPAELLDTVDAMRAAVVDCFRDHWPDPDGLRIGFDSAERVRDNGGYQYFRG